MDTRKSLEPSALEGLFYRRPILGAALILVAGWAAIVGGVFGAFWLVGALLP